MFLSYKGIDKTSIVQLCGPTQICKLQLLLSSKPIHNMQVKGLRKWPHVFCAQICQIIAKKQTQMNFLISCA
jgi:hypothetical protein